MRHSMEVLFEPIGTAKDLHNALLDMQVLIEELKSGRDAYGEPMPAGATLRNATMLASYAAAVADYLKDKP